jgi:hypothetical protein
MHFHKMPKTDSNFHYQSKELPLPLDETPKHSRHFSFHKLYVTLK